MKKKTVKFCESFENLCILRAPVATPTHTGQSALSAASGPHPRAPAPPPPGPGSRDQLATNQSPVS